MEVKPDHAGVYIPPPLFYAVVFMASYFIYKILPIYSSLYSSIITYLLGWLFIAISFFLLLPALLQFFKTKNSLISIKPANSLQTTGIYSVTRNPMYLGLLILYTALGLLIGNLWTFIFIPVLILVINTLVIKKEESYLERTFGKTFSDYKIKTRRWV